MGTRGENAVLVQLQGQIIGPVPVKDLYRLRGFNVNTFVSFPGSEKWAPAFRILNLNSYEPPMAITPDTDLAPPFQSNSWAPAPATAPRKWQVRIIQGAIAPDPKFQGRWVDRWFRRLAVFNLLLVLGGWAGWSYPSVRASLQHELRVQLGETPKPARLVIARLNLPISQPHRPTPHAKPTAIRTRRRDIAKSKPNSKARLIKLVRLY